MANDFSKITIDGTTYNVKVPNKLKFGSKEFDGSSEKTITASDLGLSNALHFIGETTTALSDGSNTSSIQIGSTTHTATTGDVVLYESKEFVWQGSVWKELGDGSSHALKTISISAGGGLTGGGTLEANRTISHADTSSQASVSASGRRYITGVTLDGYGHVTGLTTGTETVTGTITEIKMNDASKGTSGVVDLGTVLTDASKFATSAQGTKADNAMPKSGGTFTGEVKFGSTENFQGYYIKRMIGSLGAGTAYNKLDSSYKDGTWHRMWRLRFTSGSSFWGKIKITLYGGYSSFNASGVMSKSITCNFNTSNIYNNVGCYDGLGVNVEQDFRISEAIWNDTASAWEILIWQKNLSGNNSPTIMLECWTTNNTNYINAFNDITAQTVELTQSTSYSAQRASSTGGTKTVTWATLPVYENPLGEEIATVPMLEDKAVTESTVLGWGFTKNTGTVTSVAVKMNGATKGTVTSSGTIDLGTVITAHQDISGKANLNGGNTFTGQQIFQNTNSGAVAECVVNNTAWDSFTVRNVSDNTQKTAISNGYVWCQDSDAIYSRFNATGIYYGNDNNGYDCTLLFPELSSGESLEKTIATTDQIPTMTFSNGVLTITT